MAQPGIGVHTRFDLISWLSGDLYADGGIWGGAIRGGPHCWVLADPSIEVVLDPPDMRRSAGDGNVSVRSDENKRRIAASGRGDGKPRQADPVCLQQGWITVGGLRYGLEYSLVKRQQLEFRSVDEVVESLGSSCETCIVETGPWTGQKRAPGGFSDCPSPVSHV